MSALVRRTRPSVFDRFIEEALNMTPMNEFDRSYSLAVDVTENDDVYTVTASLPGVNADDVEIRLHDGVLSISAETRTETAEEDENKRMILRERRYGKFSRSLRFRSAVAADKVDANFENGILTLSIPKAEEAKPHLIKLNS